MYRFFPDIFGDGDRCIITEGLNRFIELQPDGSSREINMAKEITATCTEGASRVRSMQEGDTGGWFEVELEYLRVREQAESWVLHRSKENLG